MIDVILLAQDGFKNNKIYNRGTDSIYIHKNNYGILGNKGFVGKNLFHSKNDYGNSTGIVYGLFLAPKVKYCIVIDENGGLAQKTLSKDSIKTSITEFLKTFLM